MAKKRKMSAKQRKFFGGNKKGSKKSKAKSKQFLPLTLEDHAYGFAAGAALGPLSEFTKPAQQKYLGTFGTYSDEAAIGILSFAGWKYGKGHIKKLSKELYRGALFSAGQQGGSDVVRNLLGRFNGSGNAVSGGTRTLR